MPAPTLSAVADARPLIAGGALVVVNHSGGKDSQAMLALVMSEVPASQVLVIHAHLEGVEWEGTWDHVQADAAAWGVPAVQVSAGKTLLGMVEKRGLWPSASTRQCTSDLKRDPIDKAVRAHLEAHPQFGRVVISAMGLRAAESPARSRQVPWRQDDRNSKAGRTWMRWLPIFDLSTAAVFEVIAETGRKPHWAYAAGMSRLSCCFCIMASKGDLQTAARLNPDLYRRTVHLERRIGHTMSMAGTPLDQVVGVPVP